MVEEKAEEAADKKKEGDKDKSSGDAGKDKAAGAPSAAGGVVDEQSELQKKAKEYLEAKSGQGCMGSSVEFIRFGRILSNST